VVISADRDRAQLMLAGAFILATALIGLSIVLSAGNYTAALAGESGTVAQGDDATTARASIAADVRSYLPIVNEESYTTGSSEYDTRKDSFRDVFDLVDGRTQRIYASQGRVVTLGSPGFDEGTRIKQVEASGGGYETFREPGERDATGSPDPTWQLTNGGQVRNMTFHFSQLPRQFEAPFRLRFQPVGAGTEWTVEVIGQAGTGEWLIRTEEVGGTATYTCERAPGAVGEKTMDVSDAEMDGTYCRALDQIELASTDYRVIAETPSSSLVPLLSAKQYARGKFWLVVTEGDALTPPAGTVVKTDSDLIYSATVPFTYRSEAVTVESDLRVAPGEIE